MNQTARLAMPTFVAGQIGKELLHNEALQTADLLLCPVVESSPSVAPPSSPLLGQCFAVASGGSGARSAKDSQLAGWTEGGWRFVAIPEVAVFRSRSNGIPVVKAGSGWEVGVFRGEEVKIAGTTVVRTQQPAIAAPSGGGTNDAQARTAIGQILTALRNHGLIAT